MVNLREISYRFLVPKILVTNIYKVGLIKTDKQYDGEISVKFWRIFIQWCMKGNFREISWRFLVFRILVNVLNTVKGQWGWGVILFMPVVTKIVKLF